MTQAIHDPRRLPRAQRGKPMPAWMTPLIKIAGPLARSALTEVVAAVASNEKLRSAIATRTAKWAGVLAEVRRARTPGSRARKTLAAIRTIAEDERSTSSDGEARADDWLARAAKIEKALDLAATRPAPDRKAMLERVQARIDLLYAEVIRALIPDEGTGPEGTNDEEV